MGTPLACEWARRRSSSSGCQYCRVVRHLFDRAAANADNDEDRGAFQRAGAALRKACDAGQPWQAATALDSLVGTIDEQDWDATFQKKVTRQRVCTRLRH